VFRDQEFSSDMRSRAVERISAVRVLRSAQFVEDAGPLAHPVRPESYKEINNFYTATVYNKGAEVIRMLKTLIGGSAFRRGMDLYFARHDGEAATVEQFIACFAEASGRDLSQFMRWYRQAGTPVLTVRQSYDADARRLTLDFSQTIPATPGQPDKQPAVIPVLMGAIAADGREVIPNQVLVLESQRGTKTFENIAEPPVLSLLRGFSAPVRLDFDCDESALLTLARHDSDPFNRWEALQTYAMRLLKRSVAEVRAGRTPLTDAGLADAFRALLADGAIDPAFAALALTLPGDNDVAREIGADVDPDAIGAALDALSADIGAACLTAAEVRHEGLSAPRPFSADAESAGLRSLRGAALAWLAWGDAKRGSATALAQFESATTMTDRLNALAVLNRLGGAGRDAAFQSFEKRYRDEPLILDSWFTFQAMTRTRDALERVRKLMDHPGFVRTNPNRVRALIGAFANANPRQFHRPDGEGYRFLAGFIRDYDAINPQVAARLATAFRSYRTLEAGRQKKAAEALRSLQDSGPLSRDVADIVERALA